MKRAMLPGVTILLAFLALALSVSLTQAQGSESLQGKEGMSFAPPVHSQGQVTIRGTWNCDLDLGKETGDVDPAHDFAWQIWTDVERTLAPTHGAKYHVIGIVDFASIGFSDLKAYSYSTQQIHGSNNASNQIPQGTVVAAVTNEGRYSKFRIDTYGYNLTITWLTYEKPRTIYLPLVLRN